jgi:hypothetical protein
MSKSMLPVTGVEPVLDDGANDLDSRDIIGNGQPVTAADSRLRKTAKGQYSLR